MTTTPAALSDQTLAFTRMLVGANLAEGITTTIPSGDLYTIIDELIRLRSRPNEGMRRALEGCRVWLKASLNCSQHGWDNDQREAAEECVAAADTALALPAAVAPGERWTAEQIAQIHRDGAKFAAKGHPPVPATIEQSRGEEGLIRKLREIRDDYYPTTLTIARERIKTIDEAIAALSAPSLEDNTK